jgi:hypothetical protein
MMGMFQIGESMFVLDGVADATKTVTQTGRTPDASHIDRLTEADSASSAGLGLVNLLEHRLERSLRGATCPQHIGHDFLLPTLQR